MIGFTDMPGFQLEKIPNILIAKKTQSCLIAIILRSHLLVHTTNRLKLGTEINLKQLFHIHES